MYLLERKTELFTKKKQYPLHPSANISSVQHKPILRSGRQKVSYPSATVVLGPRPRGRRIASKTRPRPHPRWTRMCTPSGFSRSTNDRTALSTPPPCPPVLLRDTSDVTERTMTSHARRASVPQRHSYSPAPPIPLYRRGEGGGGETRGQKYR